MKLREKGRISLEGLDDDVAANSGQDAGAAPPPAASGPGPTQLTAPTQATAGTTALDGVSRNKGRSGVAAISHSITMQHRVQDLEAAVASYEKEGAILTIDPKLIRPSRWKNRHELSFKTPKFFELKAEIEGAGGNVQAIKVRRLDEPDENGFQYEIVFGRRRHRACLELGLPVNAIVQTMTDVEVFQQMERENRQREDLTPWEQGVMYKDAIDQGLFASQRQLAAALGLDQSNVSKAIKLASLPQEIIDAFVSPLDLQFRWGQDLSDALDKDAARVLTTASAICAEQPRPASKDVYSRLIGTQMVAEAVAPREFVVAGRTAAAWAKDAKGSASLKIKPGVLTPAKERKLIEFLEKLFE